MKDDHPPIREWGLLLALFLAMRLGGLILFRPFFNSVCPLEEYFRGFLGQELLQGLAFPYWHYRADNSGGGSLVLGVVAAVFFKLFGSSAFVLKSIPVVISLGALLIWFGILYREFSRKCAWYFALFFIFAPPYFQSWSTMALGDHYETMFLSALAVWLFLRMPPNIVGTGLSTTKMADPPFGGKSAPSLAIPFLLGILCGFGIWFAYIFALTVMALVILWFRKNCRLLVTLEFWIFMAGFLIGFSPWIFVNTRIHFAGLLVHYGPLWRHIHPYTSVFYWQRYYVEFSYLRDIFNIFSHPQIWLSVPKLVVNWVYVGLLTGPVLWWAFSRRKKSRDGAFVPKPASTVAAYFLIYVVLHFAVVQFTNFKAARYMNPLMPALFFGWARVMESLESFYPKGRRWIRLGFAVPVLGLGWLLWFSMVSPTYAGLLLKTSGHCPDYVANAPVCNAVIFNNDAGIDRCVHLHRQISERIPARDRRGLWNSLAVNLGEITVYRMVRQKVFSREDPLKFPDLASRASYYFHLGRFLFEYHGRDLKEAVSVARTYYGEQSTAFKLCTLGVLYMLAREQLEEPDAIDPKVPNDILAGYYSALGARHARYWQEKGVGIERLGLKIAEVFPGMTPIHRSQFLVGVGSFLTENTFYQPILRPEQYAKVKRVLTGGDLKSILRGVGQSYEINYLFFPAACDTWSYQYFRPEQDGSLQLEVEAGRLEIRSAVDEFKKTSAIGSAASREIPKP